MMNVQNELSCWNLTPKHGFSVAYTRLRVYRSDIADRDFINHRLRPADWVLRSPGQEILFE